MSATRPGSMITSTAPRAVFSWVTPVVAPTTLSALDIALSVDPAVAAPITNR